jgi:HEAT repeat protein
MFAWSPLPRSAGATFRDAKNPKSAVRLSAIVDLVRWAASDERARCVERLTELLVSDPDLEVRAAAAVALADVGDTDSVALLVAAAKSGPPRLSQMALIAIGELAPRGHPPALEAVQSALASSAPALRFQALVAAHRLLEPAELTPCLLSALVDPEPRVRHVACRISEECFFAPDASEPPGALSSALTERLADSATKVALAAAIALGRRGSLRAQGIVVRALNGSRGLEELDDEQAAIELCADLRLTAAGPGLRARAFGGVFGASPLAFQARVALARLGDARAREQILRDLSSFRRSVRDRAVAAAGQARLEAARQRLLEMRSDERQADLPSIVEALAALER